MESEKSVRMRRNNRIRRVMALALLCLGFCALGGCAPGTGDRENIVYCFDEEYNSYSDVMAQTLPAFVRDKSNNPLPILQKDATAAEAFDTQALPAVESGVAGYWYPQYLATVIIAVDRDRTDAIIHGWGDLIAANEAVGLAGASYDIIMFAAISYGLDGERLTLLDAANLLAELRKKNRLVTESFEQSIVICYDYQAAALKQSGRNIEIIVPREGTLSFERGLLSNKPLNFSGNAEPLLILAAFRLPDGRCDANLYPAASSYEAAARIADYKYFNKVCQDCGRVFRRSILRTRRYAGVDGKEHQLFALLYMILVVTWLATVIHRSANKKVRLAALLTGIILLGWITVRTVKYQIFGVTAWGRYLWFSYYLFQLALPLVALWLAWIIDKPAEAKIPGWLRFTAAVNGLFLLIVFTNDIHNFVFRIDFSKTNWLHDYGYGVAFWFVQAAIYLPLAAAVVLMLIKSSRHPRKRGFIFPLALIAVLAVYGFGYIARIPFFWESDLTMFIGVFTLLFLETLLQAGLLPSNLKYAALFTYSPLRMQIIDSGKKVALSSAAAVKYDNASLMSAVSSSPQPVQTDENTLLFATGIAGGYVLWQEDISELNRLRGSLEEAVRELAAANALLSEEEKIKRDIAEKHHKAWLTAQLEGEISEQIIKLSGVLEQLTHTANQQKEIARAVLLLCYVKRRCNLFFLELEKSALSAKEATFYTAVYFDELAEFADHLGLKILFTGKMKANALSVRKITLYYDFFYNAIVWALKRGCSRMLANWRIENGCVFLRLLFSADAEAFVPGTALASAIASAGGSLTWQDLDDNIGIALSFSEFTDGREAAAAAAEAAGPEGGEDRG